MVARRHSRPRAENCPLNRARPCPCHVPARALAEPIRRWAERSRATRGGREPHGLNELARLAGLPSRKTISRIVNGRVSEVSLRVADAIAHAMGTHLDALLEREDAS